MKPEARIFISNARKDEKEVMRLYWRLKETGYNPWIDSEDILGGEDWEKTTEKAIGEAALFLPCITHNLITHDQGMVQEEIKFALKVWKRILPVRLEDCPMPESLEKVHCVDLFKRNGFQRLINSIEAAFKRRGVIQPIRLRSEPIEGLSIHEVEEMLRANDFYEITIHPLGRGIYHSYGDDDEAPEQNEIITDYITGLMWQQCGSDSTMTYDEAQEYVAELNRQKFTGFSDWRLPTLEEAMSLMEPKRSENDLYIDSPFDDEQEWIWTADRYLAFVAWYVDFTIGSCGHGGVYGGSSYVRAVRSR